MSCGQSYEDQKMFDTSKVLSAAELNIKLAFESVELRQSIKELAPSQTFHTLGQFYGYTYNFGMPGYKEWELSDAWGRPIQFSINGDIVKVWSLGPDGVNQIGMEDDIKVVVNIEESEH